MIVCILTYFMLAHLHAHIYIHIYHIEKHVEATVVLLAVLRCYPYYNPSEFGHQLVLMIKAQEWSSWSTLLTSLLLAAWCKVSHPQLSEYSTSFASQSSYSALSLDAHSHHMKSITKQYQLFFLNMCKPCPFLSVSILPLSDHPSVRTLQLHLIHF